MASLHAAPDEGAIASLVEGLVAAPIQVTRGAAADPQRDATGIFAEFVDDQGALSVLAFADHDVVNRVGGALVGTDSGVIDDACTKQIVNDEALEGFREVVNVFASCLNTDWTPHLRLGEVQQLPAQLRDEVKQLWRKPAGRRAYRLGVDDLGQGVLILYLA